MSSYLISIPILYNDTATCLLEGLQRRFIKIRPSFADKIIDPANFEIHVLQIENINASDQTTRYLKSLIDEAIFDKHCCYHLASKFNEIFLDSLIDQKDGYVGITIRDDSDFEKLIGLQKYLHRKVEQLTNQKFERKKIQIPLFDLHEHETETIPKNKNIQWFDFENEHRFINQMVELNNDSYELKKLNVIYLYLNETCIQRWELPEIDSDIEISSSDEEEEDYENENTHSISMY